MADSDRRLVWSSPDHAIVEDGPRLEFYRRHFSELWILVPMHLVLGVFTIAPLFSDAPWVAFLLLPLWFLFFMRVRPDPLGIGEVTTLAVLDRRLGVVDLGMKPVARLDEIRASVVHDASTDAIEIHGPDLHVRFVFLTHAASERLVVELRALGLPLPSDSDTYRA
jgi:hypothetical protein